MLAPMNTATVAVTINGLDIMALEKLSIVSHALASKLPAPAGREQRILAERLDALLLQLKTAAAKAS